MKLYNEEQKKRYLNTLNENSAKYFTTICNTAYKVEFQEKSDLVNFNRNQVINLLKSYDSRSRNSLRTICNNFSRYYQWSLNEGLVDSTNVIDWYHNSLSKSIIEEILPNELIEGKFFDDEYIMNKVQDVLDPTNKLILYSPYMGIDGEEHIDLCYLNINDLDRENKIMKLYSGITIPVDDLFIKLITDANNAVRYNKDGSGDNGGRIDNVTYGESKYVFKVCKTTAIDQVVRPKFFNNRMDVIKEQTNNKYLTINLILKNGLINKIKKYYEPKGIDIYEALFSKSEFNKKLYKYDNEIKEIINEYGLGLEPKMLRHQLKDIIHFYK